MNETYPRGKESIPYPKFYDERNYRDILTEIEKDFEVLTKYTKEEIKEKNLLVNEELRYMLENMVNYNFIH